ncbi:ACP S-malonyltransferase [Mycetocola manganoxydans]|uniref:[acyl-carrier-protein] S-malonyltransferase n=1 Tax=Mycetocola manganoxydans TaxID=699879 RepID=A0A3L6ZVJ8_9MICO|nr:ACP S-malonyltransferase [Mycetocola manganoxydans]RLP71774.1 ACP S-malonyltransferase [Mycetocola manganoxydans]GHD39523.1 ACP S-malonyltransferase [Mycetocola manganoxydans]
MIVLVCPGQGSQTPGFLSPWLDDPANRELLERYSDEAGLDLIRHGTESDADTIRDTRIAQPLIVAAGLVTLRALGSIPHSVGIAGHSVGEITAAVGAGVLSDTAAMRFVAARATAMATAAAAVPTGMSAVLGGDADALLARLDDLGLEPANFNGGGQTVVAGELASLAELAATPLAGTRVVPLQVAGAFHTRYMADARIELASTAQSVTASDPARPLWTNADGSRIESGDRFVELLVQQVASPVRWDLTMAGMLDAGVTGIIELAPAGALTGLARRGLKGIPAVGIKSPDDLQSALDLLAA